MSENLLIEIVILTEVHSYNDHVGKFIKEVFNMHQEKTENTQEIISMEEYLSKRQKIRESERHKWNNLIGEEQSPAWILAGLYM